MADRGKLVAKIDRLLANNTLEARRGGIAMQYLHTQKGQLHNSCHVVAAVLLVSAWFLRAELVVSVVLGATGVLMVALAYCFRSLTVFDDGDRLALRFGPIPLFRKSIAYSDITSVDAGKSSIIDGWGIHYVPGRGWTYNLWGFGCAVVHQGKKVIRIGSDDVENLVSFLNRKISAEGS
ncbi:MAG: hypothetical protein KDA57_15760 [Planctomycetales bacterium]|nr:hypothetical protein [Planctomycetales bacterium]